MEKMTIYLNMLPDILFHPTDTFNKLKDKVTFEDGFKLFLIVVAINAIISIITTKITVSKTFAELGIRGSSAAWMLGDAWIIIFEIAGVIFAILIFLALCWLTAKLTKSISNGKGDFGKTLGLLAYLRAAVFVFIDIPVIILSTVYTLVTPATQVTISSSNIFLGLISFFITLALLILFFIWLLITGGKAVAAANNVSLGGAIAALFIAAVILFAVLLMIAMILVIFVGLILWQSGAFSPSGFLSIGGL